MLIERGASRSFPTPHKLHELARADRGLALLLGGDAGRALAELPQPDSFAAILVELGGECLGVHTGEAAGGEGSNLLGFARFRLGGDAPADLVELVRQPATAPAALAAAEALFAAAGLAIAICADRPGRILDRLLRPYYNAALNALDAGLASAADLDLALQLGLGYPLGPIALLQRSGLAQHFDATAALFAATGDAAHAPARRARVAKERSGR